MHATHSSDRLQVVLAGSRCLCVACVAAHTGAIASLWVVRMPLPADVPASLLLAWCAWRTCVVHALRTHPRATVALGRDGAAQWWLRRRDGSQLDDAELVEAFVHPLLVVVVLRAGRTLHAVTIAADAASARNLRHLRVTLRLSRSSGSSATGRGR